MHFIIFSPWCYRASFFFFPTSSLCFLRQGSIFWKPKKKNLRSSGAALVFPPIAASWMKINEKTFPLAASALGILRKFNYGDSSPAKFNNIRITRTMISLGIVTLLLSDAPNRPSLRRPRPFPRIGRLTDRPTGVPLSDDGVIQPGRAAAKEISADAAVAAVFIRARRRFFSHQKRNKERRRSLF